MSDPGYQIDKTFLKKGLARNEDDYFIATGHEMAQLWHTPYYYRITSYNVCYTKLLRRPSSSGIPHFFRSLPVGETPHDRPGERFGISPGHEDACFSVFHRLGVSPHVAGDHGPARRHRLEDRVREPLLVGRVDKT